MTAVTWRPAEVGVYARLASAWSARWVNTAQDLLDHPGVWQPVRTDCPTPCAAKSQARDIRSGALRAFAPAGRFTAHARGRWVVACYEPTSGPPEWMAPPGSSPAVAVWPPAAAAAGPIFRAPDYDVRPHP